VIAHCLASHYVKGGDPTTDNYVTHSLRADGFDASEDGTGRGTPLCIQSVNTPRDKKQNGLGISEGPMYSLTVRDQHAVATLVSEGDAHSVFRDEHGPVTAFSAGQSEGAGTLGYREEQAPTLRGGASGTNQVPAMMQGMAVRRLTPTECSRLQGFPDDYLDITFRGKPAADGPKYKSLGNSFAVPVVRWIATRLKLVDSLLPSRSY